MYVQLNVKERTHKISNEEKIHLIPAILYGKNIKENIELIVDRKEFSSILKQFTKNIYAVPIVIKHSNKEYKVIIKDIQWHKVTTNPMHIDFFIIENVEKITVPLYINFINENKCIGLKRGGKLLISQKKCVGNVNPHKLSDNTPYIEIDLTNLSIGEKITTTDLEKQYSSMNLQINKFMNVVSVLQKG